MWDLFANQNENFDSFATHSLLSLVPDEIETYWNNDDCYSNYFALCQKKVDNEYNYDDCNYNFFNWTSGSMGLMCREWSETTTGYVEEF